MSTNFAVIGGDRRTVELIKLLQNESIKLYTYGLENVADFKSIIKDEKDRKDNNKNKVKNLFFCDNLNDENFKNIDTIIGPIPFSKDGININSPYSKEKISIEYFLESIKNKTLIAGAIKSDIRNIAINKNIKIIDLMQDEKLAVLNCISTAEGAIEVAIRNTEKVIHGSNILILGFGRVSKVLAKKLKGLDVNVACAARKKEAFAWIRAYGYELIDINNMKENLSKFDIIFNTVPELILNEEKIKYINSKCLLIELASLPGGIDRVAVKNKNIKVIEALALPGKVAPVTTAKYIEEAIIEHMGQTENVS